MRAMVAVFVVGAVNERMKRKDESVRSGGEGART